MMSDEDLQRFSSLLDMTIATARNAEKMFFYIRKQLELAKPYSKPALDDDVIHLKFKLILSNDLLCQAMEEIDKLDHCMNTLLSPDKLL